MGACAPCQASLPTSGGSLMSRRTFRNGIHGVLVAGVIISLLLLAPAVFNWAGRGGHQMQPQNSAAQMDERANQRWFRGHPRLTAQPRPDGLTPFGQDFKPDTPRDVRGLIATSIGYVNLKKPAAVLDGVPAQFKTQSPSFKSHGKGGLQDGANIIQIGEASLNSMGYDRIASEAGEFGRVLGAIPDRGILVKGKAVDLARLAAQPVVEATGVHYGAYRLDPLIGQMPLIQKSRAQSPVLDLQVKLWRGEDARAAKGRLEHLLGAENVSDYNMEDRKSTRLNSSHDQISYAVFCLKKKNSQPASAGRLGLAASRLACASAPCVPRSLQAGPWHVLPPRTHRAHLHVYAAVRSPGAR